MNKTFKVIWNSSKQTCSVASELSRSHAKSSSTTTHSTFSKIFKLSAVATLLSSVSLFAMGMHLLRLVIMHMLILIVAP